ncbi:MAG: universal stress protein [Ginsengibacter sp.]
MKNILVPIDFSTVSQNASKYAASLADVFEARVTLVNVIPPAIITNSEVDSFLSMERLEVLAANESTMTEEIERFSNKHSIKVEGFVEEGIPSDIIQAKAAEKHADIIIMGIKGKGKSNSVFGSTTTAVVRKSTIPVLIIPETVFYQSVATITFATDFEADTESDRYTLLMEIAKKYNSFIQILNVQKEGKQMSNDEFIGKMDTYFAFKGFKHSFNTIEDKGVTEGIRKFIDEKSCDMLAMMAHKHSFFERMLGKAHTEEMSYETRLPLLVLQNK